MPAVAKLCDEFDVRIGIHCHGGYMFGGSPDVLEFLLKLGGPKIGLNLDTAWCMQIGPNGNPIQWVREKFKGRIFGVHYKDFVFDRRAQMVGRRRRHGEPRFAGICRKHWKKPASTAWRSSNTKPTPENPVPALTNCVAKMRCTGEMKRNRRAEFTPRFDPRVPPVFWTAGGCR